MEEIVRAAGRGAVQVLCLVSQRTDKPCHGLHAESGDPNSKGAHPRKNRDAQKTMDALLASPDGADVVGTNPAQCWRTNAASATQPDKA